MKQPLCPAWCRDPSSTRRFFCCRPAGHTDPHAYTFQGLTREFNFVETGSMNKDQMKETRNEAYDYLARLLAQNQQLEETTRGLEAQINSLRPLADNAGQLVEYLMREHGREPECRAGLDATAIAQQLLERFKRERQEEGLLNSTLQAKYNRLQRQHNQYVEQSDRETQTTLGQLDAMTERRDRLIAFLNSECHTEPEYEHDSEPQERLLTMVRRLKKEREAMRSFLNNECGTELLYGSNSEPQEQLITLTRRLQRERDAARKGFENQMRYSDQLLKERDAARLANSQANEASNRVGYELSEKRRDYTKLQDKYQTLQQQYTTVCKQRDAAVHEHIELAARTEGLTADEQRELGWAKKLLQRKSREALTGSNHSVPLSGQAVGRLQHLIDRLADRAAARPKDTVTVRLPPELRRQLKQLLADTDDR